MPKFEGQTLHVTKGVMTNVIRTIENAHNGHIKYKTENFRLGISNPTKNGDEFRIFKTNEFKTLRTKERKAFFIIYLEYMDSKTAGRK